MGGVFLFVFKDSTTIGVKHIGNAVVGQDLMEKIVIAVQSFLFIKIGGDNRTGGVINGSMQVSLFLAEPEVEGGVHLNHFTEVFAARAAGMGIM